MFVVIGRTPRPSMLARPTLRPHDLRHAAATAWLRTTGDVKAVQSLLGHGTASMTHDLYAHLLNETLTRAADLMAQGLGELFEEAEPWGVRGRRQILG
jgi:integrase